MELNELRKISEAATPGPWTAETHCAYTEDKYHAVYSVDAGDSPVISQLGCGCCDVGLEVSKSDAAFVTAFNPETALALLSRLEQAEQAVARVREVAAEYRPSIPEEVLHEVMKDIIHALDGDARRCIECNGTGDVQVRFNHGIQTQDCAVCFGTGDGRG